MEVVEDLSRFTPPPGGTAVTIGAYDGVHLGHQQLLARLHDVARARGQASAVVTFDRHPALVVRPESAPKLLTDLETRLELLAATGVDYTVVMRFDAVRSQEPAADFVRTVLVDGLGARLVAVGRDFHFGHAREGNVALLERLGPELGFEVMPVELFDDGSAEKVSSTRVRTALAAGDVALAAALLGRPHRVRGVASLRGDVADVAVPAEICLPAPGAYAGACPPGDGTARITVVGADPPAVELAPGRSGPVVVEFTASLTNC